MTDGTGLKIISIHHKKGLPHFLNAVCVSRQHIPKRMSYIYMGPFHLKLFLFIIYSRAVEKTVLVAPNK